MFVFILYIFMFLPFLL